MLGLDHDLTLPHLKFLVRGVDYRGVHAGGPDVVDALVVIRELDCALAGNAVGGVEDVDVRNSPEEGQVLESHLAGPVLADADPGVAAHDLDVLLADAQDPDLVGSPGEEGGEGAHERSLVPAGDPCSHADHVLLRHETLNELVGPGVQQRNGEGRVLHVPVESDDAAVGLGQGGQRVAVGLSRGNQRVGLVPQLDSRSLGRLLDSDGLGLHVLFVLRDLALNELADGADDFGGDRSAVEVELVLDADEVLALEGLGDDDGGLARVLLGLFDGLLDLDDIVAVDHVDVPAEAGPPRLVDVNLVLERCRLRLAQSVAVQEGNHVVQLVIGREGRSLPD